MMMGEREIETKGALIIFTGGNTFLISVPIHVRLMAIFLSRKKAFPTGFWTHGVILRPHEKRKGLFKKAEYAKSIDTQYKTK